MSNTTGAIDISRQPDILRLAEEVQATQTPRVLKRDDESLAVVMPLATTYPAQGAALWENYNAQQVNAALQESAGTLTGVDTEALLSDIKEERTQDKHTRAL
jgi:hypothetical protein